MLNSFCGRRNDVSFNNPKQKLSKILDLNKVGERYLIFSTSNPSIGKQNFWSKPAAAFKCARTYLCDL